MRYFFPCLLNVDRIPLSNITNITISNGRNNVFRETTIETYNFNNIPPEIEVLYNGSPLFKGILLEVDQKPCGKKTLKYKSKICESINTDIYILPYWYLVRLTSPGIVKKVNDITGTAVFTKKDALVEPGTGGKTDPNPFYTFKWENYFFFVDKVSALNRNFWKDFDPVGQSSSGDSTYKQYFGSLADDEFAYGACFVLYRKMSDGQNEWWTHIATIYEYRTIRFHTDTKVIVPKGTRYRNVTFNCSGGYGSPPFCIDIIERDIKTTSDLFKMTELNAVINTQTTSKLFEYIQFPKNSTAVEIIRKYAVNISLKIDKFGKLIGTDLEYIQNTYTLNDSVIFDYTLPEPVITGISFYFTDIDGDTLKKYIRTGRVLTKNCNDEVIRIERNDVDFSNDVWRIAKQKMIDMQKTGRIRTVLIPDLDLYHKIKLRGRVYRVVSFSHKITRNEVFTDIEIAEELYG